MYKSDNKVGLIEQYKQVDIDESFLEELNDNEW